ncbi:MAG: hypothetical protein ACREVW_15690, partial [Burkholderiales bacterium]
MTLNTLDELTKRSGVISGMTNLKFLQAPGEFSLVRQALGVRWGFLFLSTAGSAESTRGRAFA